MWPSARPVGLADGDGARQSPLVILAIYLGSSLFIGGGAVIGSVPGDVASLIERLPEYANEVQVWVATIQDRLPGLIPPSTGQPGEHPSCFLAEWLGGVLQAGFGLVGVLFTIFGSLLNLLLVLMLALYITTDGRRVRDYLIRFLPPDRQPRRPGPNGW